MIQYYKIGKLVATYGLKGEVVLKHSLGKKNKLKELRVLFLEEKKDSFIPYFIESVKVKNKEELFVKFEGVDIKEQAHILTQKEAWLTEEDFKEFAAGSAPISMLGFTLIENDTELGEILEVIEQPHQLLCKILFHGNEALIPLHEESLQKIDKKNRKVYVELPDGLLDMYLNT